MTPRKATLLSWAIVVFGGIVEAIAWAFFVNPDGVAYLNLSDAYARGDWAGAVNTYWGPLYPFLIGTIHRVYRWPMYWESSVVHAINFAIYLGSYACFRFMMRALTRYQQSKQNADAELYFIDWNKGWAFVLAHTLFLWSALVLIGVPIVTPDMLLSAEIYVIVGLMLYVRAGRRGMATPILLGVLLGLSYLTKQVMFPVSLLVLACIGWEGRTIRWSGLQRAAAVVSFLIVATPQLIAMSRSAGKPSFGESGGINYALYVNGYPHYWTGSPPGSGQPAHPVRQILSDPAVYEFAIDDSSSSYPYLDKEGYWFQGIRPHFDLSQQLTATERELDIYVSGFAPLFLGAVVLVLMGVKGKRRDLVAVCIVASGVFVLYALVHTEWRLVAPWAVVLFLAVASGLSFRGDVSARTGVRAMLVGLAVWHILLTANGVRRASLDAVSVLTGRTSNDYWTIASALQRLGLKHGQRVASIGSAADAYWARLAGVQLAMEIPVHVADQYWILDAADRARVHEAMARNGASMIVTSFPPAGGGPGWIKLDSSAFYALPLSR
ncbi:MAG TPA: hypothetical protein VNC11_11785 [Gemmatimonadaceae bacterium]|nr:hypothetical protein [Gemmatimonadaceae bacterium]